MNKKSEKNYTLKSVQTEIKRMKKVLENKQSEIKKLSEEIKTDKKSLRELEGIYTNLYQESLQKQIASAWFKGKKLTGEQIAKFLELSTQISDKIDCLDVADMVDAVNNAYNAAETASEENQGGNYDNHN